MKSVTCNGRKLRAKDPKNEAKESILAVIAAGVMLAIAWVVIILTCMVW